MALKDQQADQVRMVSEDLVEKTERADEMASEAQMAEMATLGIQVEMDRMVMLEVMVLNQLVMKVALLATEEHQVSLVIQENEVKMVKMAKMAKTGKEGQLVLAVQLVNEDDLVPLEKQGRKEKLVKQAKMGLMALRATPVFLVLMAIKEIEAPLAKQESLVMLVQLVLMVRMEIPENRVT